MSKEIKMARRKTMILGLTLLMACQSQANWPCYHGAQRDNRSTDTNLLEQWPENGPALIWTATDLGHGYSSVAMAGDLIVTAGTIESA